MATAAYMRQYMSDPDVRDKVNRRRRDRYAANATLRANRQQWGKKQDAVRRQILHWLKNQPCADCKNRFNPECMDFDHVRGEKSFNLGCLRTTIANDIQREAMKCEIVCANCHRTRTLARMRGQ